jgi:hypothetical protein
MPAPAPGGAARRRPLGRAVPVGVLLLAGRGGRGLERDRPVARGVGRGVGADRHLPVRAVAGRAVGAAGAAGAMARAACCCAHRRDRGPGAHADAVPRQDRHADRDAAPRRADDSHRPRPALDRRALRGSCRLARGLVDAPARQAYWQRTPSGAAWCELPRSPGRACRARRATARCGGSARPGVHTMPRTQADDVDTWLSRDGTRSPVFASPKRCAPDAVAALRALSATACGRAALGRLWGVVGMLVGVLIAAQLAWPELNVFFGTIGKRKVRTSTSPTGSSAPSSSRSRAAHRQQPAMPVSLFDQELLGLRRRAGRDGAVVVRPQRGRLLPDRRLPRHDVLLHPEAGRAAGLFLPAVDHPLLGADLPLHLGRPAPPALHRAARLGADARHGVLDHAAGCRPGAA